MRTLLSDTEHVKIQSNIKLKCANLNERLFVKLTTIFVAF